MDESRSRLYCGCVGARKLAGGKCQFLHNLAAGDDGLLMSAIDLS